jgi:ketosteroid isomerase-like protein
MTRRDHRNQNLGLGFLVSFALLLACSPEARTGDPTMMEEWKAELLAADRAFNDATALEGASGWVSFFSEEGAMVSEGIGEIRGKDAIKARMEPAFADPSFSLTWDPYRAEVSAEGDFGFTVGRYQSMLGEGEEATVLGQGLYVSIWRREAGGVWKVMMDLGNPTDGPSEDGAAPERNN